jgi:hypothetical protein
MNLPTGITKVSLILASKKLLHDITDAGILTLRMNNIAALIVVNVPQAILGNMLFQIQDEAFVPVKGQDQLRLFSQGTRTIEDHRLYKLNE